MTSSVMSIRADRLRRDIEAIAACTATPGAGASRPTFSDAWGAARAYVVGELERCGCRVRTDAAGNVHARPAGVGWEAPVWLSGSHIDSVPHGGDFDGVTGVVVPLELLRAAHESGRDDLPLELIVFAEEEGPTFGLGMLGSRAWVGDLTAEDLGRLRNAAGQSYLDAGAMYGVQPGEIGRKRPGAYRGFVEVHVEQGPGMWDRGTPLALVNAIAGRRQYRGRITGRANHAGSTGMADRQDALAGAAEVMLQLEALARRLSPQTVATVGQLVVRPGALNVIPGEADFSLDFRSPDDALLEEGERQIEALLAGTTMRRGLSATLEATEVQPAIALDADVCNRLQQAAVRAGHGPLPVTVSGALHDAAIVAPHVPTAMLFVASRDGISHNPDEFSRIEDIAAAAEVLRALVTHE
ncbi:MAG TPA: Zn-dependent hydrolase [Rhodothermales bacterium]|nr:Zn-dependent hydrolase [Rhodothermales bacterium]